MANADDAPEPDNRPIPIDEPFGKTPEDIQRLILALPLVRIETEEEAEQEVYDRLRQGRCMTCNNELEYHAVMVITRDGVVGAYCTGQCFADMAVIGYLQEQHEDITTAVKFRGDFAADEADPEDKENEQE